MLFSFILKILLFRTKKGFLALFIPPSGRIAPRRKAKMGIKKEAQRKELLFFCLIKPILLEPRHILVENFALVNIRLFRIQA